MAHVSAIVTTGIYCCPTGCSGRPLERNRRRYGSAAAAEADGFRACHVCRPYRQEAGVWVDGPELVCRALRLVLDGALDGTATEDDLGCAVGASGRHLRRLFVEHVGVTPSQLARSRRAHFARRLIDDTDLPFADIAMAASFGSIRQFNTVMRDTFRAAPSDLRRRRRRSDRLVADGGLAVRLPFDPPLAHPELLAVLTAGAVPGVEQVDGAWYRRTIAVAGHAGAVEVGPGGPTHLLARFHLPHWDGLLHLVQRIRRVFGLDVDSGARGSPLLGGTDVDGSASRHGLRAPGAWDQFEVAVAWLVRGGPGAGDGDDDALHAIVERFGTPVDGLAAWELTHLFPTAGALAGASLSGLGIGGPARRALSRLATGVADGTVCLDRSAGQDELVERLEPLGPVAPDLAAELAFRAGEDPIRWPDGTVPALVTAHRRAASATATAA